MTKNAKGTPRPATGKQNNTILRPKRWYWKTILVPPSVEKVYLDDFEADKEEARYGQIENAICQFFGAPVRRELLDMFIGMLESAEASFGPDFYAPDEDVEKVDPKSYIEARKRFDKHLKKAFEKKQKEALEKGGDQ